MAKSKKISAFTFKDTFWGRKRVEANITIVELAKLFGVSRATMGAYLTGYLMPKDEVIKGLCEFFDVNPIEGEREFINAHKAWDAEHEKTLKASAKKPYQKKTKAIESKSELVIESPKPTIEDESHKAGEELLALVYNKISYEKYCVVADYVFNDAGDPLAVIYGIVDVQTFRKAQDIIQSHSRAFMTVEPNYSKWEV